MSLEFVAYGGWKNNARLTHGDVELIVTLDVGPRILRYGFAGRPNMMAELTEQLGSGGEEKWVMRGGHRFWVAPESADWSYETDNTPVKHERIDRGIRTIQPPGPKTGLAKSMEIRLLDDGRVHVRHVLTNASNGPVTAAAWALSVMPAHGLAVVPLPPKQPMGQCNHPSIQLGFWPYTDLADSRMQPGIAYLRIHQDPARAKPFKVGINHCPGWVGYVLAGQLFLKRFGYLPQATYPDGGANLEIYNGTRVMELESLGPMTTLRPGQALAHDEVWSLHRDIPPCPADADLDEHVRPLAEALTMPS